MARSSRINAADSAPVTAGRPIPRPTSRLGWLQIGRQLISETRDRFAIPVSMQTVAVGWTDIAALADRRFVGASRAIRAFAALPMPAHHIVAPRSSVQFQDHAEQDVINGFIDALDDAAIDLKQLAEPTLRIFVSHRRGPCTACLQGSGGAMVELGVLMQLTRRFEHLLVSLGWETSDGELGHVSFIGGHRI